MLVRKIGKKERKKRRTILDGPNCPPQQERPVIG